MRRWSWWALLAGCWLAGIVGGSGCATGSSSAKDKLLRRAAFDLKCTKDELSVTKLDYRTRGVRGCGRQATYIQSCPDPYGLNCTWVMNSTARDREEEDEE